MSTQRKRWSYIADQQLFTAGTLVLSLLGFVIGHAIAGPALGLILAFGGMGLGFWIAARLVASSREEQT